MKIIGLTGGISTGKSVVARMLREQGLPVIDADELARKVVEPGSSTLQKIVEAFGREVLLEDQTLNRTLVRKMVFNDPKKLELLNSIIHPSVISGTEKKLYELTKLGVQLVILEVPLLFETGYENNVNETVVVYSTPEQQIQRLIDRDKCTKEHAKKIISAQMPIDKKVGLADYVIDNSGTLEETRKQVDKLVAKWK
jgi:dephospho-CoA kinase